MQLCKSYNVLNRIECLLLNVMFKKMSLMFSSPFFAPRVISVALG